MNLFNGFRDGTNKHDIAHNALNCKTMLCIYKMQFVRGNEE